MYDLVFLEVAVFDSLAVTRDAGDGDISFARGEEFGGRREVREDEERDEAPGGGDGAEY